mmetsp:Transcript_12122/g.35067  ORF Transcript_12122/g.35067 Transcript_12122/m.35067 type:complete len:209 (+) Transcript_12122:408-1034(+)
MSSSVSSMTPPTSSRALRLPTQHLAPLPKPQHALAGAQQLPCLAAACPCCCAEEPLRAWTAGTAIWISGTPAGPTPLGMATLTRPRPGISRSMMRRVSDSSSAAWFNADDGTSSKRSSGTSTFRTSWGPTRPLKLATLIVTFFAPRPLLTGYDAAGKGCWGAAIPWPGAPSAVALSRAEDDDAARRASSSSSGSGKSSMSFGLPESSR